MRTKPFPKIGAVVKTSEQHVNTMSFSDSVVDLSDRLKSKQPDLEILNKSVENLNVESKIEVETDTSIENNNDRVEESTESAEFGNDFEAFKNVAETKLGEFMENPEQFTEILLKFGDLIRTFFYPGIYSKIIFTSQEKIDCEVMLRNRAASLTKNEDYEFNKYELELWGKLQKLNSHKEKIPFTESEIKWLAKILSKRLANVPMAVMLEKYDWLLALLFIEGKRFLPVGQDRMASAFFSTMK